MGFNIVGFSKTLKYKIILWSLIGLGAVIFLIGIVTVAADPSAATTPATALHLNANGIAKNFDGTYSLNVYEKNTSLNVYTDPGNNVGKRVTFTVMGAGNTYLETPKSVYPGGMTTLTLKTDKNNNNAFFYNQKIEIHVQCGQIQKVLFVTTSVPKNKIAFEYQLYYFTTPISNISAEAYNNNVYVSKPPKNYYNLVTKFSVNGVQIEDSITTEYNRVKWSAVSLEKDYDIKLINTKIDIPIGIIEMVINDNKPFTVTFLITAEFLGEKYTSTFDLTIVP